MSYLGMLIGFVLTCMGAYEAGSRSLSSINLGFSDLMDYSTTTYTNDMTFLQVLMFMTGSTSVALFSFC